MGRQGNIRRLFSLSLGFFYFFFNFSIYFIFFIHIFFFFSRDFAHRFKVNFFYFCNSLTLSLTSSSSSLCFQCMLCSMLIVYAATALFNFLLLHMCIKNAFLGEFFIYFLSVHKRSSDKKI